MASDPSEHEPAAELKQPRLTTLKPTLSVSGTRTTSAPLPYQTPTYRIRGRALQEIRRRYLMDHPLCEECLKHGRTSPAAEIDHRIPLRKGGKDEDSNRQALCIDCHKVKTIADMRA